MKYDQPVWQIMHACADDLPEVFGLVDVRAWFEEHYPEVGSATIRAHVVGLTEGGVKHPQFQRRAPLFRRVSRGRYTPIPPEERGESPGTSAKSVSTRPSAARDRAWEQELAIERANLQAARDAAQAEIEAEYRRLADERAEMAQIAAQLAEAGRSTGLSISDELARLERESKLRVQHERQRTGSGRGDDVVDREQAEREQLAREQAQLDRTLRAEPGDETSDTDTDGQQADRTKVAHPGATHRVDTHGGMVIIRAPRPEGSSDQSDWTSVLAPSLADAQIGDRIDTSDVPLADVVIVGSLGDRLGVPAPARDAFRDRGFQLVRHACESLGLRWFVLSADHGLLHPTEWLSPEERGMADLDPGHHAVWASWVVARLESLVGVLSGLRVEVMAPEPVDVPIQAALREVGAIVTVGPRWLDLDEAEDGAVAGEHLDDQADDLATGS